MTSTWFCENDPVERVLYHDPAAGLLSPGIFDIENIREDGQALTRTLSQKGLEIKSQSLSQFLDVIELTELKELAHDFINVQVINDSKQTLVLNAQMMDDLKDRTIERLSDIKTVILNKVTYKCKMDPVANQLVATGYEVEPFQDLFGSGFIITPAGVILLDNGSHEMKLLEFIFSKLNYPVNLFMKIPRIYFTNQALIAAIFRSFSVLQNRFRSAKPIAFQPVNPCTLLAAVN
jgi:hypothetical protein